MVVYSITNQINGKQYVGQTIRSVNRRWYEHCYTLACPILSNAILKYGKHNFRIEILCTANSQDELNKKEQKFIKKLNTLTPNGYNLTTGGHHSIFSAVSRLKLSIAGKGRVPWNRGVPHTEESKKKMSDARKGEKHHMFGKHYSKSARKAMSRAKKGIRPSKETRVKQSLAHMGSKNYNFGKPKSENFKRALYKPILCNETGYVFGSITEAAIFIGGKVPGICNMLKGRRKTYKKLTFSYL